MRLFNIKILFCTLIGVVEIIAMSFRQQHIIGSISRLCRPTILKAFRSQNNFRSYSNTAAVDGADSSATSGGKKSKKKSKPDSILIDNKNSTENLEDFRQTRLKKISTIRERGGNPFAYTFDQTHKIVTLIQTVPPNRNDIYAALLVQYSACRISA